MLRSERGPLLCLAGAWLAVVLLVDPRGEFPVNDDWAFAASVRALAEEGRLAFTGWQSMPLLTHVLWGAAFHAAFGGGFLALRISTLVLALVALLTTYLLAREAGASRGTGAFVSLLILSNPLFLPLSFSFMSDVPFLAFFLLGLLLWLRGLRRGEAPLVGAGIASALLATLSRQNGLAAAIGVAIGVVRRSPGFRRALLACVPVALMAAALLAFESAVGVSGGLPLLYYEKSRGVLAGVASLATLTGIQALAETLAGTLATFGVLLLPLAVRLAPRPGAGPRRECIVLFAGLAAGALLAALGHAVPGLGNVWNGARLGPILSPGLEPAGPPWIGWGLSLAGGAGAALLLARLADAWPRVGEREGWPLLALLAAGVVSVAPALVASTRFLDRYLLPILPLLAVVLAGALPAPRPGLGRRLAPILLLVQSLFSVAATHDYLAWQRARFAAVAWIEETARVPRGEIAGGLEVDNERVRAMPDLLMRSPGNLPWLVSISPVDGYEVRREVAVGSWLPWSLRRVYALERPARR